ncbi:hypothetical protein IMG5_120980 [Ichthyophthirius multifiliis]|uniref:glycerol kinase n=1 Tax=Ichthyophthirius multifiliis TaxID=5932 RepID=G0QV26_ICHMU|nr:hypothetical protein IMG5_120980 [Ichthyophthirius multifiliis]EGR30933.1 hypothetical protein IMG5_120980 [Ichthyophthirius multifiliis]|eukprot:XP_004032520.1 hypothetical protein IMG5_120980 [Ichthyophthirius multifiliis]
MNNNQNVLIGAIDQSTTSTKFGVFDQQGNLIDIDIIPHDQISQHPGWLEHNPQQILNNLHTSINNLVSRLQEKGYSLSDLKTIGVTNQRETVVAWNKHTGKPYYNAIVWCDNRTQYVCEKFTQQHAGNSNIYQNITGLPISQLKMFNKQEMSQILMLFLGLWILGLYGELKIPINTLPIVLASSDNYGTIKEGTLKGKQIQSCLGDQQAAALGHGVLNIGDCKTTFGSGSFLLVNIGEKPIYKEGGLLTTILYKLGKNQPTFYAFEGSIEVGGSTLNWAKENLGLFKDYEELASLIEQTQDNGNVYFVPALNGLLCPYWQSGAQGIISGISFYTKKEHILRALLEGIAFRTKDVIVNIEQSTEMKIDLLKVDGGLTKISESTMLGVAFAAGIFSFNQDNNNKNQVLYQNWLDTVNKSINK